MLGYLEGSEHYTLLYTYSSIISDSWIDPVYCTKWYKITLVRVTSESTDVSLMFIVEAQALLNSLH